MNKYNIEMKLYHDCLYNIQHRIDVIANHLSGKTSEVYQIVEVETICLQFRKILEDIALMSLVANKEKYAEQHEHFAKHYNARLIFKDLERINPYFYPIPIIRILQENGDINLVDIEEGYLTKEEFLNIYDKCGSMMHAYNPFSGPKPLKEFEQNFPIWLSKIYSLLKEHKIKLIGHDAMIAAILRRDDNGLPQAVILEAIDTTQTNSI